MANRKGQEGPEEIAALILGVRAEDPAAFPALASRYAPLLEASLARYAADCEREDREDLRQTALLALYRAAMSYDLAQPEVSFGLYAKICISNALVSQLRIIRRRASEVPFDELPEEAMGSGDDPARRLLEAEAEAALHARIRAVLSRYEYRVWCLFAAGRRPGEIAALLGRDPHSVENAVFRIRRKLRAALAPPH